MNPATWNPGDVIVFRGLGQSKIWYALPVIVVEDRDDLLALFWRAGTTGKWRLVSPEIKVNPDDVINLPIPIIDRTWKDTDVLMLITPGAAHAVYIMWEAGEQKLICWYINLQDPVRRTPIGFDTQDHWLDVVVTPSKDSWKWKDEDQLRDAVELGIVAEPKARAIRAEGDRVIRMIQENQPPFCDGWEKWAAPPGWKIPSLPETWDTLF